MEEHIKNCEVITEKDRDWERFKNMHQRAIKRHGGQFKCSNVYLMGVPGEPNGGKEKEAKEWLEYLNWKCSLCI